MIFFFFLVQENATSQSNLETKPATLRHRHRHCSDVREEITVSATRLENKIIKFPVDIQLTVEAYGVELIHVHGSQRQKFEVNGITQTKADMSMACGRGIK